MASANLTVKVELTGVEKLTAAVDKLKESFMAMSSAGALAGQCFQHLGESVNNLSGDVNGYWSGITYPVIYGDATDSASPVDHGVLTVTQVTQGAPVTYYGTDWVPAMLQPGDSVSSSFGPFGQASQPTCPQCGFTMKRGDVHGYDWCRVDGQKQCRLGARLPAQTRVMHRRLKPLPKGRAIDLKGETV